MGTEESGDQFIGKSISTNTDFHSIQAHHQVRVRQNWTSQPTSWCMGGEMKAPCLFVVVVFFLCRPHFLSSPVNTLPSSSSLISPRLTLHYFILHYMLSICEGLSGGGLDLVVPDFTFSKLPTSKFSEPATMREISSLATTTTRGRERESE